MKLKLLTLFSALSLFHNTYSQKLPRPKLVVGIVVDQMRWDYLYRYYDRYGSGGFKRLLREGFSCENTLIPYSPAHTGAGHASVYTGSVPAIHAIMGNNWYDAQLKRVVYCVEDNSVHSIGSNSPAGKMSPVNLQANTITDELRLATNFQSKTISIALKDRGSILPGGFTSNGSFWFDNTSAGWISSSFYMQELPEWMKAFNSRNLPQQFMKAPWNTLYPLSTYVQSTSDSNEYEDKLPGGGIRFPHRLDTIGGIKWEAFKNSPAGNSYTFETAKAAVRGEALGKRNVTDFLAVSFSSTDYIGHTFGPNSIEIEDAYLRFDQDLSSFLTFLDTQVGKGQYLLFLTADHGAGHNPVFMEDHRFQISTYATSDLRKQLNDTLQKLYQHGGLVTSSINYQLHLDDSLIRQAGLDKGRIKQVIIDIVKKKKGVINVVDLEDVSNATLPDAIKNWLNFGFHPQLSGDLQILYKAGWTSWKKGATHGQWNPYDTHIPLLWYGWGINKGKTHREVYMTDIAATLAALLKIQMPNGSIGKVVEEAMK